VIKVNDKINKASQNEKRKQIKKKRTNTKDNKNTRVVDGRRFKGFKLVHRFSYLHFEKTKTEKRRKKRQARREKTPTSKSCDRKACFLFFLLLFVHSLTPSTFFLTRKEITRYQILLIPY
jgi:hypothetical protein